MINAEGGEQLRGGKCIWWWLPDIELPIVVQAVAPLPELFNETNSADPVLWESMNSDFEIQ